MRQQQLGSVVKKYGSEQERAAPPRSRSKGPRFPRARGSNVERPLLFQSFLKARSAGSARMGLLVVQDRFE